jgi:hypothetical protein
MQRESPFHEHAQLLSSEGPGHFGTYRAQFVLYRANLGFISAVTDGLHKVVKSVGLTHFPTSRILPHMFPENHMLQAHPKSS